MSKGRETLGKVLEISDDVTKKIGKVVAGINQIEKAANSMAASVKNAYQELGGSGLNAFMQQVAKATKTMRSGKVIDSAPIKEANTQAERLASSIGRFVNSISSINSSPLQQFIDKQYIANRELERMGNFYRQLRRSQGQEALAGMPGKSESSAMFNLQIRNLTTQSDVVKRMNDYYRQLEESVRAANKAQLEQMPGKSQSDAMFNLQINRLTEQSNAIKKLNDYYRELESTSQKASEAERRTPKGALDFASKAKTYASQVKSLQYLEEAYKSLGNTESDVATKKELSKKMKELRKDVKNADKEMGRMQGTMSGLIDWGAQLGRAFALVFSISQIRGYVSEIARVRGEFELQATALGAMLDNKEKADELFGQITELAVKSPFTLKQLFSYTKQLSAYGFEADKLYDTTKRLADVSAGLGVDMGRLALALGQVKAANYLRGTETRQFTEAGFNILKELAKYYSELEDRMVSVGEVQSRVTKRLVSFGDVETVFKRVTSAGGQFYDMQAKMANTLLGQMSNLRDRLDLMMNDIGKSNQGVFMAGVKFLQELVENWELVALALKVAVPALIGWKVNAMLASDSTSILVRSVSALKAAMKSLNTEGFVASFKKLGKGGWVAAILIAIEAVWSLFDRWGASAERTRKEIEKYNEVSATIKSSINAYKDLSNLVKEADESDEDFAQRKYDAKRKSLESLSESLEKFGLNSGLDFSAINTENIDDVATELEESAKAFASFGRQWSDVIGDMATGLEIFGLIGENIKSDSEDLNESAGDMSYAVAHNVTQIKNALIAAKDAIDDFDPKLFDRIMSGLEGQREGENIVDYYKRLSDVLGDLTYAQTIARKQIPGLLKPMSEFRGYMSVFRGDIQEYNKELDKSLNKLQSRYYNSREEMVQFAREHPVEFMLQLNKSLADSEISGFAAKWANTYIPMVLDIQIPPDAGTDSLEKWKRDILDWQGGKGLSLFREDQLKQMPGTIDFINAVVSKYKEADDWLQKYTSHEKTLTGQQKENYNALVKSDRERLEIQKRTAEAFATQYGINLHTSKKTIDATAEQTKKYKELISTLQKAGREFSQLLRWEDEIESKKKIDSYYGDLISSLASSVGIDGAEFVATMSFDPSGIETALEHVAGKAADVGNKEAERAARQSIASLQNEKIAIKAKVVIDEKENVLEEALNKLKLGESFKDIGLGKDIISRVLGIETFDISQVKDLLAKVEKSFRGTNGKMSEAQTDLIDKWRKKLNEEERKVWETTFKEYSKYLKSGVSETVKIMLEEASALEKIENLRKSNLNIQESEIALMKEGVKEETKKRLAEQKWADFTESPLYIRMFENLETASTSALEAMKNKLDEIKGSLGDMSPDVLKTIMDQYNQLEDQLVKRKPFESLIASLKVVRKLKSEGKTPDKLAEDLLREQQVLEYLKDARDTAQKLAAEGVAGGGLASEYASDVAKQEKVVEGIADNIDAYKKLNDSINATASRMQLVEQIGGTFLDSALTAIEAFGGEVDDNTKEVANFLSTMLSLAAQIPAFIASIYAAGLELSSALGIIGLVSMALSALVATFSLFSNMHDNTHEKAIERELDLINSLQKAYEKLHEKIAEAYSFDTYEKSRDLAEENLRMQNEALRRAIAAEEEKKKTDSARIKEWQDQIEKNIEAIQELEEESISAVGGFGTGDNIKSAAEDFVNAWVDAFNETGDGLSGLTEQMDEFLDNAVRKQLLMRLSKDVLDPALREFDRMFEESSLGGRDLTGEELEAWRKLYEKKSEEFNNRANAIIDALGIAPKDMDAELSGIQRGIQGVTETTAQALEALLNSIRFYSSDTNSVIKQLYFSIMSADENVNPMLAELRSQTRWLSSIHDLIKSSTKSVGPNGNAMKVVIV